MDSLDQTNRSHSPYIINQQNYLRNNFNADKKIFMEKSDRAYVGNNKEIQIHSDEHFIGIVVGVY